MPKVCPHLNLPYPVTHASFPRWRSRNAPVCGDIPSKTNVPRQLPATFAEEPGRAEPRDANKTLPTSRTPSFPFFCPSFPIVSPSFSFAVFVPDPALPFALLSCVGTSAGVTRQHPVTWSWGFSLGNSLSKGFILRLPAQQMVLFVLFYVCFNSALNVPFITSSGNTSRPALDGC